MLPCGRFAELTTSGQPARSGASQHGRCPLQRQPGPLGDAPAMGDRSADGLEDLSIGGMDQIAGPQMACFPGICQMPQRTGVGSASGAELTASLVLCLLDPAQKGSSAEPWPSVNAGDS